MVYKVALWVHNFCSYQQLCDGKPWYAVTRTQIRKGRRCTHWCKYDLISTMLYGNILCFWYKYGLFQMWVRMSGNTWFLLWLFFWGGGEYCCKYHGMDRFEGDLEMGVIVVLNKRSRPAGHWSIAASLSTILADFGVNIAHLLHKWQGWFAIRILTQETQVTSKNAVKRLVSRCYHFSRGRWSFACELWLIRLSLVKKHWFIWRLCFAVLSSSFNQNIHTVILQKVGYMPLKMLTQKISLQGGTKSVEEEYKEECYINSKSPFWWGWAQVINSNRRNESVISLDPVCWVGKRMGKTCHPITCAVCFPSLM